MDAWIYLLPGFAHSGSAFAVLGGVYGYDPFAGALTAAKQLKTAPGKTSSTTKALLGLRYKPLGSQRCHGKGRRYYRQLRTRLVPTMTVTAKGEEILTFYGSKAPAYSFVDDVKICLA